MSVEKTHLKDVIIYSEKHYSDERGYFMEAYNYKEFQCPSVIDTYFKEWPQDNVAMSKPNVLRGMHIQRNNPQGKLVRCLLGVIMDVVVDLRKDSPTFKQWGAFELSERSKKALWVPPGFAHGYYSYSESIVYYKCSTLYDKQSDGGINPFDTDLSITWPSKSPIMSEKDKRLPSLEEWLNKGK